MWWLLAALPAALLPLLNCMADRDRKLIPNKKKITRTEDTSRTMSHAREKRKESKKTKKVSFKDEVELLRSGKKSSSARADAAIRADQKAAALAMLSPPSPASMEVICIRPEPKQVMSAMRGGLQSFELINEGSQPRAFKVKCSDNHLYRVKPVFGVVEAGQSTKIEILRQNGSIKVDRLVIWTAAMTTDNAKRCLEIARPDELAMTVVPLLVEG